MMNVLHTPRSRRRGRRSTGLMNAERVHRVLSAAPCALPSDSDERSRLVARKLQTGDPSRLAEIVRDLTWHQRRGLANARDWKLLRRAILALSTWLAAYKGIGRGRARKRIQGTVNRTASLFTGQ
jgi:RNA polymerase-interacting CarD/CdnL/TRCF family regulator